MATKSGSAAGGNGFFSKFWPALLVGVILSGIVTPLATWRLTLAAERRAEERKQREINAIKSRYQAKYDAAVKIYSDKLGELVYRGKNITLDNPNASSLEVAGRAIVSTRNALRERLIKLDKTLNSEIDELERDIANLRKNPENKTLQEKVRKTILVLSEQWPAKAESIKIEIRKTLTELGLQPIE